MEPVELLVAKRNLLIASVLESQCLLCRADMMKCSLKVHLMFSDNWFPILEAQKDSISMKLLYLVRK